MAAKRVMASERFGIESFKLELINMLVETRRQVYVEYMLHNLGLSPKGLWVFSDICSYDPNDLLLLRDVDSRYDF